MSGHLLSGLRVLDVATVIAAPVAATMLADFGADVIKVEQPGEGDLLRKLSYIPTTPDADCDWFWQMDGRNKRSITLNLKHEQGRDVLTRLIRQCDVFITNQPQPVRRALRLTYHEVRALNPGVIYGSLSAYGETGPDRDGKGFDLVAYWARSGLMDLVRDPAGAPAQALPGMGDHPTAVSLYAGIVTALLHRERTGEGALVETSLLANGLWSAGSVVQGGLAGGDVPGFVERRRVPPIMARVYATADHRHLQFTMVRSDEELQRMFDVLGLAGLLQEERFATPRGRAEHRAELGAHIQERLLQQDSDTWLAAFAAAEVAVNRVQTLAEVVEDEQIGVNRMAVPPVDASMDVPLILNHPVRVSSAPQVGPRRAPELGEHTEEVLGELGYDADAIQRLREDGAI